LGSDEDCFCQLFIEHGNDKSPGSQEEIDYTFHWRQGTVYIFPQKLRKRNKAEQKGKSPKWDPLSCLPPPYNGNLTQTGDGS
jgi:hypothetical protein